METFLNRNFIVKGNISCLYQPGAVLHVKEIANIEIQLWHKTPMEVTLLGKGMTNSTGEFIIEFEIDSPASYLVDGKIKNTYLEAFYSGQKLDFEIDLLRGLVGYWKFDETSGTTATDATGNNHTGNLAGSVPADWTTGKINNGVQINGDLDGTMESFVSVAASEDFDFGVGDFTYAFWMKPNNTSGAYCVIDTGYSAGESFIIQFNVGGALNIIISAAVVFARSPVIVAGNWYHLVVRRIDDKLEVFINGASLGREIFTGAVSVPAADLIIGSYLGGVQSLDGTLDELGIWKGHGLNDMEIASLYNNGNGLQYPF